MNEEINYEAFIGAIKEKKEELALELLKNENIRAAIIEDAPLRNHAFCMAAGYVLCKLFAELLSIEEVRANAAVDDNYALKMLAHHGCLDEVELLLAIPLVLKNVIADQSYVLRISAGSSNLTMLKRLLKEHALAAHVHGIKRAIRAAYQDGSKMCCYELFKTLGPKTFKVMHPKWNDRLRPTLKDVLDSKVTLAQIYKESKQKPESRKNRKALIYSLPYAVWRKIAEFNTDADSELLRQNTLTPFHLFVAQPNYSFLLEEAIEAVDKIMRKSDGTKKAALKV